MTQQPGIQRATVGALVSGLATQAGLVVSGVISARLLGPENRGYFALLILVPSILAQLGMLGMPQAVTYFTARDPSTARGMAKFAIARSIPQIVLLVPVQIAIYLWLFARAPAEVRLAGWVTLVALAAI